MSIQVDPADLARTLGDYGVGYLLSTSPQGRIKAITITARVEGDVLVVPSPSTGTAANLAENPVATLLFPPLVQGGYTLLVDGSAKADVEGFRFFPTSAVLHRPATEEDTGSGASDCGQDCVAIRAEN